jgi:peptide/nickel transport system permease protein
VRAWSAGEEGEPSPMTRYALRRLLAAIPLILGVLTILFVVLNLAPGDPTSLYFGPNMSPEVMEQIRRNLGLDQPLPVRYVKWLGAFLQGDFQLSFAQHQPVRALLAAHLPNTIVLTGCALVLSFVVGIFLGVVQAVRRHSVTDSLLSVVTLTFYSVPSFWLAMMLIMFFSVLAQTAWGWPFAFPASGVTSADYDLLSSGGRILDRLWHLVLPVLSLTLVMAAGVSRYVRTSMLDVLRQDYIRTARAKGLSEGVVIRRHALRNGLIPVVTLLGLYLPLLFSGAVFVEVVFAWPGMGRLVVNSILARDYPVVMAGTFLFATLVVAGNLLADLLYAAVDPRVRHDRRA